MVPELFKNLDSLQKNSVSLKNSNEKLWIAKAPGSLMLMGEHAVLYGRPALVAAINRSIQVTLKQRQDKTIVLISTLGKFEISLDDLPNVLLTEPFKFVLAALQNYTSLLLSGFELKIESDFSEKMGFGSSAAVVVAVVRVLNDFIKSDSNTDLEIYQQAKSIVLKAQGQGSGADVAASVFGGLIYYQLSQQTANNPTVAYNGQVEIQPLIKTKTEFPNIIALYSGAKVKTPEVISYVQKAYQKYPALYDAIFDAMANCRKLAGEAILKKDWVQLGELMNMHHGFQSALGVSNSILESLVYRLRNTPGIFGAKISGAGLGDCVIGIGFESELKIEKDIKVEPIILQLAMTQ